jgi:dihydrofolate synthase/folylpolyglutamate synthase
MEDKDIRGIVEGIVPIADYVIFTKPDYYRSASPEKVMRAAAVFENKGEIQADIPQALDKARNIADSDDMILVCGSLFTVGAALTSLDVNTYPAEDI